MRYLILLAVLCVGCVKQEPERPAPKPIVPTRPANDLSEEKIRRLIDASVNNATKEIVEAMNEGFEKERRQLAEALNKAKSDGSPDRERLLREYDEASVNAATAKREYEDDIRRAATLTPEEQIRLREINKKRKAGEGLTAAELELASQFHEFRDFVKSESERRAKAFGISPFDKARK